MESATTAAMEAATTAAVESTTAGKPTVDTATACYMAAGISATVSTAAVKGAAEQLLRRVSAAISAVGIHRRIRGDIHSRRGIRNHRDIHTRRDTRIRASPIHTTGPHR